MRELLSALFKNNLLTIYKFFVGPHLDHGNVSYNQPKNESFCKIEQLQYQACLAIIGAIKSASRNKMSEKLSLKSPKYKRRIPRLCMIK